MSQAQSAVIIPFPSRPRAAADVPAQDAVPAVVATPTEPPAARLKAALAMLDTALAEQRQAVADWRNALEALNGSVHGLGRSLSDYRDRLQAIADTPNKAG